MNVLITFTDTENTEKAFVSFNGQQEAVNEKAVPIVSAVAHTLMDYMRVIEQMGHARCLAMGYTDPSEEELDAAMAVITLKDLQDHYLKKQTPAE
jgi:hypothetical protein